MPMNCILGERERLKGTTGEGVAGGYRTRVLLLGGETTMTERVFCLGADERSMTDESKPLEIEIWDLVVEPEDTEMTSWSGSGGAFKLLVAFTGFVVCMDPPLCLG
jgi:hypothetical protein